MPKGLGVLAPAGFAGGAAACGLKSSGKPDVALIVSDRPAHWAGTFTRNKIVAAPVKLARQRLRRPALRAVVINAGNANACTGKTGDRDAGKMTELAASALGIAPSEAAVASTGIIGEKLDMAKVALGIRAAAADLGRSRRHASAVQRAILTTDLAPKSAQTSFRVGSRIVKVGGICKGSGMIAPRMGTMLAFLATDVAVETAALRRILRGVVDESFNCVTVDGDCSTNDSVFLLANGASGAKVRSAPARARFADALREVAVSLARQIAADGEGATKLVTVTVSGARSAADARKAARAISESPLVKTALNGADPNWGRIVCAAGRSGAAMNAARAKLTVQGVKLFASGAPVRFDRRRVARLLRRKEVRLELSLGAGRGAATFWTCDLSKEYITINAEYHT